MNTMLIFPLTPALLFFIGAFGLLGWQQVQTFIPTLTAERKSIVGLAIAALVFGMLAGRISLRLTDAFTGAPRVIAPWGTGDGITVRMDGMSTAFLFVPVLLLIAGFWGRQFADHVTLLALAGATAVVFVAANGIGFSDALLLFDVFGALFWLKHRHSSLALARLFLSVLTTGLLMLAALPATADIGSTLFSLALWLRLSLLPFMEVSAWGKMDSPPTEAMIWTALSTAIGVYTAARFLPVSAPLVTQVLVGVTTLLNALLVWLGNGESTHIKLLRMSITQPGLILLFAPVTASVAIALGLGYTLALGALWLTPNVGRPNFLERHWLWIYAAPILATLTIAGFPFTFGWVAHLNLYTDLLQSSRTGIFALVLLAEGLGFSALYHYWKELLAGHDQRETALLTALMLTIPFLLPGLAGITFNIITGIPFEGLGSPMVSSVLLNLALVWVIAIGAGYGQPYLMRRLSLSPTVLEAVLQLDWLWATIRPWGRAIETQTLRLKAAFEGAHYFGWAFLLTLVGILVVILR